MTKVLCIWHGNCQDGFGAAWSVRHALGDDVEFHPGVYQDAPPDVAGRDVLMVDFAYKRPVLDRLAASAATLLILDHHKSAAEDLAGFPAPGSVYNPAEMLSYQRENNAPVAVHALFDMERSGAGLTWDYLHPTEPRPVLIDHIEDRDLWQFKLDGTRAISALIFSHPYDFKTWDWLVARAELGLSYQEMLNEGEAIERKHHQDIDNLLPVVRREMVIGSIRMPVACLPLTLTSDAGHRMASEAAGVAACYWDTPDGRVFSLRSTDIGPDVSLIATGYGGGGHRAAAGFRMPLGWEGDQ
jgi:oligoribonuclease NrnB/cAMP/cGMP phosphodiesterase (DHH superfamily)